MMMEEVSADNAQALAQLFVALWPDCSSDEAYQNVQEVLHSQRETCFLGKQSDVYIAFVQGSTRTDYVEGASSPPTAYIEGLYVQEGFRRLGIAQKMLQLAADWGRGKGCRQLASDTEITNNASIEFHHKSGFQEAGRIVCFIKPID